MTGNARGNRFRNQPASGIADSRHPCIRNYCDPRSRFQLLNQFGGALPLIVLVATDGRRFDLEMIQQLLRLARVFAGDAVGALQYVERAQRNVAEIADGRRDKIKSLVRVEIPRRLP